MFKKFLPQIIAMLFLAGFIAYAWTEPASPPPGGNVAAPINVGTASQYKSGAFGLGGLFHAFSDAIFDAKVGIGTTNPQGLLDVGGGKFVVTTEGVTNFTAGPNSPTSAVNSGGDEGFEWQNPSGALTSNNNYAFVDVRASWSNPNYLSVSGFNFSLPSDAKIDGIEVGIEGYQTSPNIIMEILLGVTKEGFLATADDNTYKNFGGPTDKWSSSWTAASINNSSFGLLVRFHNDIDIIKGIAYIDHIRVKVYYHTGGTDVAKVGSSVIIKGDGSLSTNLNADKLDDQHASELRPSTGLFGRIYINYSNICNGAGPACYPIGCQADFPGQCQSSWQNPGCNQYAPSCPVGYTAVLLTDTVAISAASGPVYCNPLGGAKVYSCLKQ